MAHAKAKTPAPDEFAATMQQLSAEAAKNLPVSTLIIQEKTELPKTELAKEKAASPNGLESKIDKIEQQLLNLHDVDLEARLSKIDAQLAAIRNTESVHQRLFDSLHEEMLKYRDNFLHESLQKPFIHDLVHLFDDLTALISQLRSAASEDGRGNIVHWRDNLENAVHSLIEILHRFEVREVEPKEKVDRTCHKVVSFEPAEFPEDDGRIVMRIKRGFVWRGKLIRPEEVIAKRYN